MDTSTGSNEALTGQQVTATLNLHGAPLAPGTTPTYSWSQANTNLFKTWDETAPNSTHATQLVPLADGDYTGQSFAFYDATKNDKVTLTCTVTFTTPDGVSHSPTITSASVTFLKPTVTAWGVNTGTDVQAGLPSGIVQAGMSGGAAVLYADERWGPITVTVPPLGTTNVSGQGGVAQVIQSTGDADVRSTGGNYLRVVPNGKGGYVALPTPALDTAFPYPIGYTLDSNGKMTVATSSSTFSAPGTGYSGDEPKLQIFPNATDTWTSSNLSIHFATWVMYQPPNGNWVPLQMLTWDWGGSITKNEATQAWTLQTWNHDPGSGQDATDYPQWNATIPIGSAVMWMAPSGP